MLELKKQVREADLAAEPSRGGMVYVVLFVYGLEEAEQPPACAPAQ